MAQWRAEVASRVRSSAANFSGDGSGVSTVTFTVTAGGGITGVSGSGVAASVVRGVGSVPPPPGWPPAAGFGAGARELISPARRGPA